MNLDFRKVFLISKDLKITTGNLKENTLRLLLLERRTPRFVVSIIILLTILSTIILKSKKESKRARPSNFQIQTCLVVPQKRLHLRDITLGEKTKIDTDSSIGLIREEISTKIIDRQKLSKKCNALSGTDENRECRRKVHLNMISS
ncbi:hypothetical protein NPIL_102221 [Nephila pilipes]|uniref:Uncharacterized protein n=1 Tax=Nephila pilipes TaxID=299642 RepID=A0A8X6T6T3_NEPPI|nr:hypothetical protein NPIL_102221 [Nephila pilipes]